MPPPIKTTRERWIEQGLAALADGGPDAIRVESMAKAIGVTKGGFYGLFANRDEFVAAMLDSWEQTVVDGVIEQIDQPGEDPRARIEQLFALAGSNGQLLRVDLAIRDWARRDEEVAERLARIDDRRMEYLRSLFEQITDDPADAEARTLLAATLWVGSHVFAPSDPRRREAVYASAMRRILD